MRNPNVVPRGRKSDEAVDRGGAPPRRRQQRAAGGRALARRGSHRGHGRRDPSAAASARAFSLRLSSRSSGGQTVPRIGMIGSAPCSRIAARQRRVSQAPSAVTVSMSSSSGICVNKSGRPGLSPCLPKVNPTARISPVAVSIAKSTFRHSRLRIAPCLNASHSPSPRKRMRVLSISRFKGAPEPRYGVCTAIRAWCPHRLE